MPDGTKGTQFGTGRGTAPATTAKAEAAVRHPVPRLTVGVEEEFLLLDPATGCVVPAAEDVRRRVDGRVASGLVPELTQFQLETNSTVHTDLGWLQRELLEMRGAVAVAAAEVGARLVACGTALHGNAGMPPLSVCPRYHAMLKEFGAVLRGQGVCGCHVHVGIGDREEAVLVSNHARPWLPVLQALTGNSPISDSVDTGYASWRAMMMGRWPSARPPPYLRSVGHYESLVDGMRASGVILDRGMIYWLIRLSDHVPTLEFRTADSCATVAETTMLAGLVRGLAATALRDVRAGVPAPRIDDTLLNAAWWRAARDGVEGEGLDLMSGGRMPAWDLVGRLVEHVRPGLEESGDWPVVARVLGRLRRRGSGAARQRAVYARRAHLPDVADLLVRQTLASPADTP
ncbi:glutamate--cysteine ligase [Sphaerimonospora cavernae]|uniref:Putative glutamate--cysteine ligase 2 n=1 Tax=Sphaerimonospora cavernae TaxID=1740611 RepID=A0ABV6UCZ3_9ACTN